MPVILPLLVLPFKPLRTWFRNFASYSKQLDLMHLTLSPQRWTWPNPWIILGHAGLSYWIFWLTINHSYILQCVILCLWFLNILPSSKLLFFHNWSQNDGGVILGVLIFQAVQPFDGQHLDPCYADSSIHTALSKFELNTKTIIYAIVHMLLVSLQEIQYPNTHHIVPIIPLPHWVNAASTHTPHWQGRFLDVHQTFCLPQFSQLSCWPSL